VALATVDALREGGSNGRYTGEKCGRYQQHVHDTATLPPHLAQLSPNSGAADSRRRD